MYDIIIRNGIIFDGYELVGQNDLGIKYDIIYEILDLSTSSADINIDATGKIVCPGFIDIHNHVLPEQLNNNDGISALSQGITSVITGNCGNNGHFGSSRKPIDYLKMFSNTRLPLNVGTLIGYNSLRNYFVDQKDKRISSSRINEIKDFLNFSISEMGAFGLSTGVMYHPFSSTSKEQFLDELIQILDPLAELNVIYSTHIRDEGDSLVESVNEQIDLAKIVKIQLQLSHHKSAGKRNWGKVKQTLEIIEHAKKEIIVNTDFYPYTSAFSYLYICLPQEPQNSLKNGMKIKPTIKDAEFTEINGIQRLCRDGWNSVIITVCKNKSFIGKSILEISESQKTKPYETLVNVLNTDNETRALYRDIMSDSDMETVAQTPFSALITDGYVYSSGFSQYCHPRSYGAFTKFLREFVFLRKKLSIQEGLRKMTSLPAEIFALTGRGEIKIGNPADLVVFDPQKVKDNASYRFPNKISDGVLATIINGKLSFFNGQVSDVQSGIFLKKGRADED